MKTFHRMLSLVLCAALLLSMAACTQKPAETTAPPTQAPTTAPTEPPAGDVYAAAREALDALGLHLPILGMVKDDRHRTRALMTAEGQELGIQQSPPLFTLIGRIQEEVHRFAITYHHEKHKRSSFASRLDGIPGVGEARKAALMKSSPIRIHTAVLRWEKIRKIPVRF